MWKQNIQTDKEDNKMNNADRHIYLYAKGWYERNNKLEDMKIIIGERSGLLPEWVSKLDIETVLIHLTWKHIQKGGEYLFSSFVAHCINDNIVIACLSILAIQNIADIGFDLGQPDYNLLPKPKE